MSEVNGEGKTRAPWHLWVVGIGTLLWNAMGAFDYLMTQTRNAEYMKHFSQEQLDYFYGFPRWIVACWALAVWGGVLGSLLLVLRKAIAVPVFVVSFATMALTTFYNFVLTDGMKVMGGVGAAIFSGVIFVVALALVFYSRAMRAKGVLA